MCVCAVPRAACRVPCAACRVPCAAPCAVPCRAVPCGAVRILDLHCTLTSFLPKCVFDLYFGMIVHVNIFYSRSLVCVLVSSEVTGTIGLASTWAPLARSWRRGVWIKIKNQIDQPEVNLTKPTWLIWVTLGSPALEPS